MASGEARSFAQRWLEASDLGLGRLFHHARDAVVVGSAADGSILLWNRAAETMFGYTAEEAAALSIEALVPEPLRGQHRAGLKRYASTGVGILIDSGKPVELPALCKDGSILQVELSLSPLDTEAGADRYVMAIIRDVTEREEAGRILSDRTRELERSRAELERTLQDLRAAHEEVKHVTAIAAHDLGGPLTAVFGLSQILRDQWGTLLESRKREIVESIARQADRLKRLSADLLTASRLDSGTIEPQTESIGVAAAIRDALNEGDDSVGIAVSASEEDHVLADPRHLSRILGNYVGNAMKHGAPPVTIRARRVGATVQLRVSDGGEGVADDLVPRLFSRFARGSGHTPGAGLGLSIVRGLARANGGDAWYEPNSPKGATFCVSLPASGELQDAEQTGRLLDQVSEVP